MTDKSDYFASPRVTNEEFLSGYKTARQYYISDPLTSTVTRLQGQAYSYVHSFSPSVFTDIPSSSALQKTGEKGELTSIVVPWSVSMVDSLYSLISNSPVTWEPKTTSNDAATNAQIPLIRAVYEDAWNKKGFNIESLKALKNCLYYGEGYILSIWDFMKGNLLGVRESETHQAPVYSGSLSYFSIEPWYVIRGPGSTWETTSWFSADVFLNKHDLIALFPEKADEINAASTNDPYFSQTGQLNPRNQDLVRTTFFYHRPSPAVLAGRKAVICGDAVLMDDPMGENEPIPLQRLVFSTFSGSSMGIAKFWSVLAAQEVTDAITSTIISNLISFGHPVITCPEDANIEPESFGPYNLLKLPPGTAGDVKPILLSAIPLEAQKEVDALRAQAQQVLNLSDAARGIQQGKDLNAAATALQISQTLSQLQPEQKQFQQFLSEVGNTTLWLIKNKMTYEDQVDLVGVSKTSLANSTSKYTGASFKNISSIRVAMQPPILQSDAGRQYLADTYQKYGFKFTAETLNALLMEGRIDSVTADIDRTRNYILAENECLQQGKPVKVLKSDPHQLHYREHLMDLQDPEIRFNDAKSKPYFDHLKEHLIQYFNLPADIDPTSLPNYNFMISEISMNKTGELPPQPMMGPPGAGPDMPVPAGPVGMPPREPVRPVINAGQTPDNPGPQISVPKNPVTKQPINIPNQTIPVKKV